jgi:hypothetical protein
MNKTKLIRNYDFAEADFDSLPKDLFRMNLKNLSKMDQAILDGIKYQITISKANMIYQYINYRYMFRTVSTGITFTVIGFALLSLTYYANVNLNLGMKFLTDLFA